jgi:aspartyl-tRNA(Asn)/glutamyl-tRNA(Gln) amidotransferase subunit C
MPGMSAEPASITVDDVRHLAALARIDLDDEHLARLRGQLDQILHAVAQVQEVAGADVPPTSHPLPLTNVSRPDVLTPSLSAQDALSAAPAAEDGRFRVPRILDEEA